MASTLAWSGRLLADAPKHKESLRPSALNVNCSFVQRSHRRFRAERPLKCRVMADCVAKLFSAPRRERSIQDRAPSRNIDSKARAAGFDYFKFQFHRLGLATLQQNRPTADLISCLHTQYRL